MSYRTSVGQRLADQIVDYFGSRVRRSVRIRSRKSVESLIGSSTTTPKTVFGEAVIFGLPVFVRRAGGRNRWVAI